LPLGCVRFESPAARHDSAQTGTRVAKARSRNLTTRLRDAANGCARRSRDRVSWHWSSRGV